MFENITANFESKRKMNITQVKEIIDMEYLKKIANKTRYRIRIEIPDPNDFISDI